MEDDANPGNEPPVEDQELDNEVHRLADVYDNQEDDTDGEVENDEEETQSSSSSSDSLSSEEANSMGARLSCRRRRDHNIQQPVVAVADGNRHRRRITFNRDLPATHSYLGDDFEDVGGGRQVLEGVTDNVPLFPVPHLMLAPGQTLPLQSLHPRAISMFRNIIANHHIFAVITIRSTLSDAENAVNGHELASIGTLAQVVAYKEQIDSDITTLKLRAIGRQRFKLLKTKRQIDGTLTGQLNILPEISLERPLKCFESVRYHHFSRKDVSQSVRRPVSKKYSRYYAANFSTVPWFVYKQYDIELVVKEVAAEMSSWYDPAKVATMSANRVDFSYWVASNLPIDDDTKLQLLAINCCLQRLRCELAILKRCNSFVCVRCEREVCRKQDVFSLSVDGPMGAYVNPGGYVHEMVTVLHADGVRVITGAPTSANSWFPGYAWQILNCITCHSHMGWKFSATSKALKPSKFWGVVRSAIGPRVSIDDGESLPTGNKTAGGLLLQLLSSASAQPHLPSTDD